MIKTVKKAINIILIATFGMTSLYIPQASAQWQKPLPMPGVMVHLSPEFTPAIIRGMTIDVKNPFAFNFLVDQGDSPVPAADQKEYYQKLIKYFLSAMTIAEDKQWVNLSPYEGNRIVDSDFGKTEMGRDLLAQDYLLKQITASLLYPEDEVGRQFWQKVYKQAAEKFGTTQIPVNTFNKVWIVPDEASVYEKDNTVLIVDSKLKVMLEEDYLATEKNRIKQGAPVAQNDSQAPQGMAKKVLREIVIPVLEKEVNEGKNFANLRQIYHGMILATWYKQALKESILTQIYANKDKVKGVDLADPTKAQQEVYQQYVKAFKKGVYNFIKEENDPVTGQMIPRKYFSGGFMRQAAMITPVQVLHNPTPAMLTAVGKYIAGLLAVSTILIGSNSVQAQTNSVANSNLDQSNVVTLDPKKEYVSFVGNTNLVWRFRSGRWRGYDEIVGNRLVTLDKGVNPTGIIGVSSDQILKDSAPKNLARDKQVEQMDRDGVFDRLADQIAPKLVGTTSWDVAGKLGFVTGHFGWVDTFSRISSKEPGFKEADLAWSIYDLGHPRKMPSILDRVYKRLEFTRTGKKADPGRLGDDPWGLRQAVEFKISLKKQNSTASQAMILPPSMAKALAQLEQNIAFLKANVGANFDGEIVFRGNEIVEAYLNSYTVLVNHLSISSDEKGIISINSGKAPNPISEAIKDYNESLREPISDEVVAYNKQQLIDKMAIEENLYHFEHAITEGIEEDYASGEIEFDPSTQRLTQIHPAEESNNFENRIFFTVNFKGKIVPASNANVPEAIGRAIDEFNATKSAAMIIQPQAMLALVKEMALEILKRSEKSNVPENQALRNKIQTMVQGVNESTPIEQLNRMRLELNSILFPTGRNKASAAMTLKNIKTMNELMFQISTFHMTPEQFRNFNGFNNLEEAVGKTVNFVDLDTTDGQSAYNEVIFAKQAGQRVSSDIESPFMATYRERNSWGARLQQAKSGLLSTPLVRFLYNTFGKGSRAMNTAKINTTLAAPTGGIDFDNPDFNLRVKRDGKGMPLPLSSQDPAMINAPGFVPMILKIESATNMPLLSELKALASQQAG